MTFRRGGVGAEPFYTRLAVAGEDAYEFAAPCGTCGVIFNRLSVPHPINDGEAVDLLGDLRSLPTAKILDRLAQPLPSGQYTVGMFEGVADLALPGAASDFFVEHYARLKGAPGRMPRTAYLRHGNEGVIPNALWWGGGRESALVASLICPLQDIGRPDEQRVQHWIDHHRAGGVLTALAVSIVDQQAPADGVADETYPHREHRVLLHFLIDGHHRAIAAARLGVPLRILAFVSWDYSNAEEDVVKETIDRFCDHAALG